MRGRLQRWVMASLVVAGMGLSAGGSRADQILQASETAGLHGHFNQLQTTNGHFDDPFLIKPATVMDSSGNTVNLQRAPQACVPTSVANSFVFLQNQGITGLGGADPHDATGFAPISYDTINTLASAQYMNTQGEIPSGIAPPPGYQAGTSFENAALGKEKYLQDNSAGIKDKNGSPVAIRTVGQSTSFNQAANGPWIGGITQTTPTADFIRNELADGEDVELFFTWTDKYGNPIQGGGGHCVNLYGIKYDRTTNSGQFTFIDPFASSSGSPSYNAVAPQIPTSSLTQLSNGYLFFSYSGGAAGINQGGDNPLGSTYGVVTGVLSESPYYATPVPLPPSWVAGTLLLGLLGLFQAAPVARYFRLMKT